MLHLTSHAERPEVSPWMEGVSAAEDAPSLEGDLDVDVAVVGAGFTGLSTAIRLRAEGLSVAVLERAIAGHGASGRNAGHLTPTIGKDLPTLALLFGKERASALVRLVETAVGHVEGTIRRHAIDCAYEPVGNVMAAVHPKQYAMIDRAAKAAREFGADGELLDEAEMRRRGLPLAFRRGWLERRGGILHPGRYVRGLRRVALAAGARLFERTPVEAIDDGEPAVVRTAKGRVRARSVVLGTNAWTPSLGRLRGTLVPLHVYLFRTAPLTEAQVASVGWRGREGVYTAHEILESWRLTDDGRIVGGSKVVRYAYGGGLCPDDDPAALAALQDTFRRRFPELRDLALTEHWGGPIALVLDFLPWIGRIGRRGNVYVCAGYAGHGLALASYAGEMIADLMLGRDGPGAALWTRRWIPMPPEPFRWLTVRALTGLFESIDRRVDRALEHGR
ncbi:MAG: FAD-dependent oxidoreductase [Deltaproteobacteria bacterium]|nr:FAD-dependent oxidoreductase [Deltaproteobacteria bacterium]